MSDRLTDEELEHYYHRVIAGKLFFADDVEPLIVELTALRKEVERLKKWIARFDLQPNMGAPDA